MSDMIGHNMAHLPDPIDPLQDFFARFGMAFASQLLIAMPIGAWCG